jgi:hypothetical protein
MAAFARLDEIRALDNAPSAAAAAAVLEVARRGRRDIVAPTKPGQY